jgi:hypothetical protein
MATPKDFTAEQSRPSGKHATEDHHAGPVPGAAPIKTPNPTDAEPSKKPREVPKVGSQDAPGG